MTDPNQFLSPGINVLLDGQWGSTGKGKLSAFLASNSDGVTWNTADFQPNAGHTVVFEGGTYVTKMIPSGYVNLDLKMFLTSAATINVETFLKEIAMLDPIFKVSNRIWIHPHAGVVMPEDIEQERAEMGSIASTMTGGGAALRRKIARKAKLAKDIPELAQWVSDKTEVILFSARHGGRVLAETAQGFDLSLNHGHAYPYTTSRVLNNLGAPPQLMSRCWASMRTMPIRVGHYYDKITGEKLGDSGPFYPDHEELEWDEVEDIAGTDKNLTEMTTVTKRVRRIFTWSEIQFRKFLRTCQPTDIFMNFVNYLDDDITGVCHREDGSEFTERNFPKVSAFMGELEMQAARELGVDLPNFTLLGTGADNEEMIVL